jgi:hypothetical protein
MDLPLTKVCSNCKIEKPLSDFYKYKKSRDGVRTSCKDCCKAARKKYVEENPTKIQEINKIYTIGHRAESRERTKKWQKENPKKIRECNKKWENNKRLTDPAFKILQNLRSLMRKHLKGIVKGGHSVELVGMLSKKYFSYLETTFWPGMTSENDGPMKWEVDHIIPLSSFNLTDPEEQKKAFHWSNTRALWKDDNRNKGARLDWTPAESKHPLPEWTKGLILDMAA